MLSLPSPPRTHPPMLRYDNFMFVFRYKGVNSQGNSYTCYQDGGYRLDLKFQMDGTARFNLIFKFKFKLYLNNVGYRFDLIL